MPFDKDQTDGVKFLDADDEDPPSLLWLAGACVAGLLLWVALFKTVDWLLAAAWSAAAV